LVFFHRLSEDVFNFFLGQGVDLYFEVFRKSESLNLEGLPLADQFVDLTNAPQGDLFADFSCLVGKFILTDCEESLVLNDQVKRVLTLKDSVGALAQTLLRLRYLDFEKVKLVRRRHFTVHHSAHHLFCLLVNSCLVMFVWPADLRFLLRRRPRVRARLWRCCEVDGDDLVFAHLKTADLVELGYEITLLLLHVLLLMLLADLVALHF